MSEESGGESATAASATLRAPVAIASTVVEPPIDEPTSPMRSPSTWRGRDRSESSAARRSGIRSASIGEDRDL